MITVLKLTYSHYENSQANLDNSWQRVCRRRGELLSGSSEKIIGARPGMASLLNKVEGRHLAGRLGWKKRRCSCGGCSRHREALQVPV